ncbi:MULTISPECIES: hypothetical protein [Streptomyces]|uniref:hypothetical protein n=1 Tax=Streptomyces TaxID=1883 RepID=UPI0031E45448
MAEGLVDGRARKLCSLGQLRLVTLGLGTSRIETVTQFGERRFPATELLRLWLVAGHSLPFAMRCAECRSLSVIVRAAHGGHLLHHIRLVNRRL